MITDATFPDLRDQIVVITGGGSGIGADLVRAFAEQGSQVVFLDIDDDASVALVEELREHRHRPVYRRCDLTDIPQLQATLAAIEKDIGVVGILVNNAGNDNRYSIDEASPDYWDWTQAVNVRHQFFAIQAVVPGMRRRGRGSIINLSSISWMRGAPNVSAYAAAKAAVVGLTTASARDLGPSNIRVNAIAPGAVLTEKQRRLWLNAAQIEDVLTRQCIPRELDPKPVARMALFLASETADMITKQVFVVDAGLR